MSISGFPKTAVSELKQGGADLAQNPLPVGGNYSSKTSIHSRLAGSQLLMRLMAQLVKNVSLTNFVFSSGFC